MCPVYQIVEIHKWAVIYNIIVVVSMPSNISISNVNLIDRTTYRFVNFEDNFEKKDGLARGLIAFVSCVCV